MLMLKVFRHCPFPRILGPKSYASSFTADSERMSMDLIPTP